MRNQGRIAGIYCNTANANQISTALSGNVEFWVAHYCGDGLPSCITCPADSGVPFAGEWQFTGDSFLSYGGTTLDIDLDTSVYTDPSTKTVNKKK
jgi:GH25 family lysozyme M1 (1,4-beta-N-acetylmuramidase)